MGDVKQPHMVTRGYIAAWADERNVVEVVDKQHDRVFRTSIGNATTFRRVYDPQILTHDLEAEFDKIESAGVPALGKLRDGVEITAEDQAAVIAFLDMHLHRGRFADRAGDRLPAVAFTTAGESRDVEMGLGDVMLLARERDGILKLASLGLDKWQWKVWDLPDLKLATGDGAVLLWGPTGSTIPVTITFPLSPTKLLVIGEDLADRVWINAVLERNCRRWMVGVRGTFKMRTPARDRTEQDPSPAETGASD